MKASSQSREERLAAALRANLKRRKARDRALSEKGSEDAAPRKRQADGDLEQGGDSK